MGTQSWLKWWCVMFYSMRSRPTALQVASSCRVRRHSLSLDQPHVCRQQGGLGLFTFDTSINNSLIDLVVTRLVNIFESGKRKLSRQIIDCQSIYVAGFYKQAIFGFVFVQMEGDRCLRNSAAVQSHRRQIFAAFL